MKANSSRPTIRPSVAEARLSSLATGCSTTRTSSIPFMFRSCMGRSAGRSLRSRWLRCRTSPSKRRRAACSPVRFARWMTARRSIASRRRRCRPCAWCRTRASPNSRASSSIGWVLPIDDTSFRIYVAGRVKQTGDLGRMRSKFNGKDWGEMSEEEHQRYPGDYEAQVGQGPITIHSEEHFAQSDRGCSDNAANASGAARFRGGGARSDRREF